jgi:23S rRNA pseudouridine1911/1915/1917 synthase
VHAGKRIDAPIGRDPGDRQKMSTRARRARSAVTRVTRAEYFRGVTLLQVAIATGPTHQIRVHLNAIGHPIVGDPTYGGVRRHVPNDIRAVQRLERPFLHSAHLAFTHPGDGRRVEFDSPLPLDLQAVIDDIEARESEDGNP